MYGYSSVITDGHIGQRDMFAWQKLSRLY